MCVEKLLKAVVNATPQGKALAAQVKELQSQLHDSNNRAADNACEAAGLRKDLNAEKQASAHYKTQMERFQRSDTEMRNRIESAKTALGL
jgi:septal ring factor EnvC (AmiA/AmiB activator)